MKLHLKILKQKILLRPMWYEFDDEINNEVFSETEIKKI